MGTTLIAMRYKYGVYVATDSQTSSGFYVSNRAADKISKLSEHVIVLRSGSSADTQNIVDLVRNIIKREEIEKEGFLEVRAIAQILRDICYDKKFKINCGFICAGWDKFHGGQIYSIIQGGTILTSPLISSGSGSIFINSFCDANFKDNMNDEETNNLIMKAVSLAIQRDANSGGLIRICKITNQGITKKSFFPSKLI
jgi:20S proteasome subunit beta 1